MKSVSILPADIYSIINKSLLNDNDRLVLFMLYQPIVGSLAISLYFTLWSDLNKDNENYTHHHLMNVMNLRLDEIVMARKKIEAVGLLKTYINKENNNYVYELFSPLTPSDFFTNPILASSLLSTVGKKEYQELVNYYKIKKVNTLDFENITTHFSDIFMMSNNLEDVTEKDIRSKEKLDLIVDDVLDFNFILTSMSKIFNEKNLTPALRKLINRLAYLYNFDNEIMISILKDSLNEKGMINELELKKNCKNYYSFEHSSSPKLIYKSRNSVKKDDVEIKDLKNKLIECFECTTPYDFLKAKYGGSKPTPKDISLIESLLVDQELNPGVVNVLVDYVLRTNDKKLNKNFVEAIASQWKMSNINTVKDAMLQAEKEYRKINNNYKTKKEYTKEQEKLPTWYGKDIKKEEMSNKDLEELQNMLNEFE